jgi:hypothetical protein
MRQVYSLCNSNWFCGDHNPAGAVGSVRETSHAGAIAPVIPGLFLYPNAIRLFADLDKDSQGRIDDPGAPDPASAPTRACDPNDQLQAI